MACADVCLLTDDTNDVEEREVLGEVHVHVNLVNEASTTRKKGTRTKSGGCQVR